MKASNQLESKGRSKIKTGITLGDPSGIGPEIILKSAEKIKKVESARLFVSKKLLKKTALDLGLLRNYQMIENQIIECCDAPDFQYGKPTKKTGRVAIQSLTGALQNGTKVLITLPLVKAVIKSFIPDFIGHTEFLAQFFGVKEYAMVGFYQTKRIMLLTTHQPLRLIFRQITVNNISKKIYFLNKTLKKYFGVMQPKIAVSALNPHGFEFSQGEEEKINTAIQKARKSKIKVEGPYPADSLFNRKFDGFLTMYHDQAMIYLKSKHNGLNFTAGLPIIRLSPLYGAALDIAGQNQADTAGFINALNQGIRLFKNARNYEKNFK